MLALLISEPLGPWRAPLTLVHWALRIEPSLDDVSLDRVRSALGLNSSGRLTDSWNELFGEARWSVGGRYATVELWRDVDTAEWRVDVEFSTDVPVADVEPFVQQIRAGLEGAGLEVTSAYRRPSGRT
ncbi:hypothetical protein V6U81_23125 [Micromonospora sp. CPCC 205711]|uniref:hypothetical protein n=1 Tax=Micromonospora sp. CPCC 205547 TaxID=3122400 RepID=UPI002FF21F65